jgi:hypothetical protein
MGVDIDLSHIGITLGGGLAVDPIRIDPLSVGVTALPQINAAVTGLPIIKLEASVKELPVLKLEASVKELPLIRTDSKLDAKIDAGLDNIRITELPPIHFELGFRPIRVHLPLNYHFCFELFGKPIFKFSVCGEGMLIGEDYQAHETEQCK